MTQPAFGQDLSCLQDEDAVQSEVNGFTALAQALARRLQTPRGTLLGDSAYGYFVIGEIDNDVTAADVAKIGTNIDAEFVKDQRVLSSFTSATFSAGVLVTQSTITTTAGPWTLTLAISNIVQILGLPPQGNESLTTPYVTWTPESFGVALIGDWSFSPGNVTLDGSANVQSVLDMSANVLTASQASAGLRPGYSPAGGGGDQGYIISALGTSLVTSAQTIPQPVEVFVVARSTASAPAGNGYLIDFSVNTNAIFQNSGADTLQQYSGSVGAQGAIVNGADFLADAYFSGASSSLAINGGPPVVANAGTSGSSSTAITLGNSGAGGGGFIGFIYRIVAINRLASDDERSKMHQFCKDTYNTP